MSSGNITKSDQKYMADFFGSPRNGGIGALARFQQMPFGMFFDTKS
ncbi:hypothetical protein [Thalassoroseus pseudoceratinae]|nr:hypothetical protein [Thalassoroseus pseudoceratinae]